MQARLSFRFGVVAKEWNDVTVKPALLGTEEYRRDWRRRVIDHFCLWAHYYYGCAACSLFKPVWLQLVVGTIRFRELRWCLVSDDDQEMSCGPLSDWTGHEGHSG